MQAQKTGNRICSLPADVRTCLFLEEKCPSQGSVSRPIAPSLIACAACFWRWKPDETNHVELGRWLSAGLLQTLCVFVWQEIFSRNNLQKYQAATGDNHLNVQIIIFGFQQTTIAPCTLYQVLLWNPPLGWKILSKRLQQGNKFLPIVLIIEFTPTEAVCFLLFFAHDSSQDVQIEKDQTRRCC